MELTVEGFFGPVDEWDVPLGGLQGLSRVMLERTHVEGAVAEVRFVAGSQELSEQTAAAVWEALGPDEFPVFEPSTQNVMTLEVTASGALQRHIVQQGWLLATPDRARTVTLLPSQVILQTRTYSRYSESLAEPLRRVLEAFAATTGVTRVARLGLRYVNKLSDPAATTAGFWDDHIREQFAGPLDGDLASLVTSSHQQTQLQLDATAAARIQNGVFEEQPGLYGYLLDLDVFREQAMTFDGDLCANQMRQLNRTAVALFARVLSDDYLAGLGPTPAPRVDRTVDDRPRIFEGGADQ